MKKLLLLALLIVGCEEALEPQDCTGVAGGTAVLDDCGICDGIDGYVAGTCYDCAGVPFGTAQLDNCGVCDTDLSNDCVPDCAGVSNGEASVDECGLCTGGTTGLGINYLKDECGLCGGDNSSCKDCLGIPNGTATMDNCGICDTYTTNDCVNHVEMDLEIMPSSIYKISDWFSGTINLATLSIQNITNETKEISIYYQGRINGESVVAGQTHPMLLIPGEVKIISNVNFDPYSIWWYSNELNFINSLISIGHLLTGNYSIQINAYQCDDSIGIHSCTQPESWWISTGYTSTDTLYTPDNN